jgi:hypothetical protein
VIIKTIKQINRHKNCYGENIMKKTLVFLIILLLPLSAWAMTPVTDSDLSDITGQAGVSINPDMTMDITINTMAWGDADGITGVYNPWTHVTQGGYIGVNNFNITNLKVRLRTEAGEDYNSFTSDDLKPITFDVATGTKLTYGNRTFVRFGLGSLQISLDELSFDVSLGTHGAYPTAPTLNQNMGVVTLGAMDVYINPNSYVDIYSHAGSGVNFDMNVTLDRVVLPYMSWGDKDGLPGGDHTGGVVWMAGGAGNDAGYIGLYDFRIGDPANYAVKINGSVAIDIATSSAGVCPYVSSLLKALDAGAPYLDLHNQAQLSIVYSDLIASGTDVNNGAAVCAFLNGYFWSQAHHTLFTYSATPLTIVHISFPANFNIDMAKMVGRVVLADASDLGFTAPGAVPAPGTELGDLYLHNLKTTIGSGSWVDIWAH